MPIAWAAGYRPRERTLVTRVTNIFYPVKGPTCLTEFARFGVGEAGFAEAGTARVADKADPDATRLAPVTFGPGPD